MTVFPAYCRGANAFSGKLRIRLKPAVHKTKGVLVKDYSSDELLLSVVCDTLGVHSALLFLPGEDDAVYVDAAVRTAEPTPVQTSIAPGKGLVGWILRNRQPLILNSFDARLSSLGYYDYEAETSITSFMGVPLANGGVLCVDSVDGRNFSTRDQQLLQRFATLVEDRSEKIDEEQSNASIRRYFESIEKIQALRDESLPWRSYLQRMLNLLLAAEGYDYAALAMCPEDAQFFVIEAESEPLLLTEDTPETFPLSSGLVGWVFTEGMPIFADGLEASAGPLAGNLPQDPFFKCAICLPVMHSKIVCGVLILANQDAVPIPEGFRAFVTMAARELGSYLETLYLRHRVQSMLPRAQMYFDNAPHDPDREIEQPEDQEM